MRTSSKVRFSWLLALLCLVLLLAGCTKSGDELTVVFPKLGAADCAVILAKDETVVIDTGEAGDEDDILDILSDYGRDTIDLLLISHYDKDHVGGAAGLLDALPVGRVIGSSYPKDSEEYAAYQLALSECGLTEEHLTAAETIHLESGLVLTVCPPEQHDYGQDESNNASVAVALQYGSTRMLFTGDAMEARTQELLGSFSGTFDLIKLPHHGRETTTAQALSDAFGTAQTAYVVTSSKKEPEQKHLESALSGPLYLTRKGEITAVSDGSSVKITQS